MSEEVKQKIEENRRTVQDGLDRRKTAKKEAEREAKMEQYEKDMLKACNGRNADANSDSASNINPDAVKLAGAKKATKAAQKSTAVRSAANCNQRVKDILKKIAAPAAVCAAVAAFQYFNLDRLTSVRAVMFLCAIVIAFNAGRLFECNTQGK